MRNKKKKITSNSLLSNSEDFELQYMLVNDGLSKYYNYISKNYSRIPKFSSSSEAKAELQKLILQNKKNHQVNSIDFANRLFNISKQNRLISTEAKTISDFRSNLNSTKSKEDDEYHAALYNLSKLKDEYFKLQFQSEKQSQKLNQLLDDVSKLNEDLKEKRTKSSQLVIEQKKLTFQENKLKYKLESLQETLEKTKNEELKFTEILTNLQKNTQEFNQINKLLLEKQAIAEEKRNTIRKIFAETEKLENDLDIAVDNAKKKTSESFIDVSDSDESFQGKNHSHNQNVIGTPKIKSYKIPSIKKKTSENKGDNIIENALKAINMKLLDDKKIIEDIEHEIEHLN